MKYIILLLLPFFGHAQSSSLKFQWKKISGPLQYTIESPDAATTRVFNLVSGIYQFELKVTNSAHLSARDTMILTVYPSNSFLLSNRINAVHQNFTLTAAPTKRRP
jgi:hypothetical protein